MISNPVLVLALILTIILLGLLFVYTILIVRARKKEEEMFNSMSLTPAIAVSPNTSAVNPYVVERDYTSDDQSTVPDQDFQEILNSLGEEDEGDTEEPLEKTEEYEIPDYPGIKIVIHLIDGENDEITLINTTEDEINLGFCDQDTCGDDTLPGKITLSAKSKTKLTLDCLPSFTVFLEDKDGESLSEELYIEVGF